jgi:GT2 family glycosyltransferase
MMGASTAPRVYIVLVTWKGWRDTIECLESVFRMDYPEYRVVVCDNASPDGSLERVAEWARGELPAPVSTREAMRNRTLPPVRKPLRMARVQDGAEATTPDAALTLIQTGANLGFAGANNVGIRWIQGRGDAAYVWLLNNDTVVDREALTALVEEAEREADAGMIGSLLLEYDEPERIQAVGGGHLIRWQGFTHHVGEGRRADEVWEGSLEPDYVTGASMLVRRAVLDQTGGLDTRYFLYSEEVDWCLRARELGWRMRAALASRVWHKGGKSVRHGSPLHDYHAVRGMLLLVRRFHPRLLPLALGYSLVRCLLPKVARREGERFRAVLRAYRDVLSRPDAAPSPASGAPTASARVAPGRSG